MFYSPRPSCGQGTPQCSSLIWFQKVRAVKRTWRVGSDIAMDLVFPMFRLLHWTTVSQLWGMCSNPEQRNRLLQHPNKVVSSYLFICIFAQYVFFLIKKKFGQTIPPAPYSSPWVQDEIIKIVIQDQKINVTWWELVKLRVFWRASMLFACDFNIGLLFK